MSDGDDGHAARVRFIVDRVKEFAAEHRTDFVFICSVPTPEGDSTTPMTWSGHINTAYGLANRAVDRLRHRLHECDFPPDPEPPDATETWKPNP